MTEEATTTPVPLLVDAVGVGKLLGIGRTSVFSLLAAGRLPPPVLKAGRIVRWNVEELRAWCNAGTPPADVWRTVWEQRQ